MWWPSASACAPIAGVWCSAAGQGVLWITGERQTSLWITDRGFMIHKLGVTVVVFASADQVLPIELRGGNPLRWRGTGAIMHMAQLVAAA